MLRKNVTTLIIIFKDIILAQIFRNPVKLIQNPRVLVLTNHKLLEITLVGLLKKKKLNNY